MSSLIPAFIFAAKSTDDPKGSVPTQAKECREAIEAKGGRAIVGEPFTDVKKSAFSGNRGPGLAACLEAAVEAANQHGEAEIWVQHSDRLARGSGKKGEARHLALLFLEMQAEGVRLRSVQDDHNLEDVIRAVLIGERNHEDSKRKSQAVSSSIRREHERGRFLGRPPNGYKRVGSRETSRLEVLPAEVPIANRIFTEFVEGKTMTAIARGLQADGIPTKAGAKRWSQAAISSIVRNPVFIGKVRHSPTGELFDGQHKGIVDPALFAKAQSLVKHRDANGKGRPPKEDFLLRGLLVCGECEERMYPRERIYECVNYECPQGGISRPKIDNCVIEFFQAEVIDFDATRAALIEARDSRVQEASEHRARAEREGMQKDEALTRKREQFKADEIDAAEWREFRTEIEEERDAALAEALRWKEREAEIEDEVAQIDADQELLERLSSIQKAAAGEVQDAEGIAAVRAALTRLFSGFVFYRDKDFLKPVRRIEGDDPGFFRYNLSSDDPSEWTIDWPKFVSGKTALELGEKNKTRETCSSSTSPCQTHPGSTSCARSANPMGSSPASTPVCR